MDYEPISATGVIMTALALSVAAQDWHHDRDERFRGEQWRFISLCTCERIWSTFGAAGRATKNARASREPKKS
jgi:hypothetical protein